MKEKAREERRQKKAFTSGRNAAAELKVLYQHEPAGCVINDNNALDNVKPKPTRPCWRGWENPRDRSLAICFFQWTDEQGQICHLTAPKTSMCCVEERSQKS